MEEQVLAFNFVGLGEVYKGNLRDHFLSWESDLQFGF